MEDFNRLIELLLPTFLRQSKIVAMLRALVTAPLQSRHTEFNLFREKTRYEAAITPQVCSLMHAINRNFDVSVEITELDGKPYDYLVSIDRSTDLNAIRDFLNRFSLAGKTFLFALGDTIYTAEWSEYVDENLIERYTAQWIDYVVEHDGKVNIEFYFYKEVEISDKKIYYKLEAIADTPVKSNINIKCLYFKKDLHAYFPAWIEIQGQISLGQTKTITSLDATADEFERDILIISIEPLSDSVYTYITNFAINYHKPFTINLPPGGFPPIYATI